MASPLKAMVERKTVRYASAEACLYAAVPASRIVEFSPGTAAKASGVPVVYAVRNEGTEDSGSPADTSAGGTWAGMVCARRFVKMTCGIPVNNLWANFRAAPKTYGIDGRAHGADGIPDAPRYTHGSADVSLVLDDNAGHGQPDGVGIAQRPASDRDQRGCCWEIRGGHTSNPCCNPVSESINDPANIGW